MQEKEKKNKVRDFLEKSKEVLLSGMGSGLRRAQMCYYFIVGMMLFVHIIYALLFQKYENYFFVWYNIEVSMFYAWCLLLVAKKRYRTVVTLVHLEIIVYCCVSIILLGWDYGFAVFFIVLASITYINPFHKEHIMFLFAILEAVVFLLLWAYTLSCEPVVWLEQDAAVIFCYINYCSCFVGIIAASGMSQLSSGSLMTAGNRLVYNQETKVFSREYFHQSLRELLDSKKKRNYTLLCVRIVDYPLYREYFGQEKAEEVLKKLGEYLKQTQEGTFLLGHISSDIFGLLMEKEKFEEEGFVRGIVEFAGQYSNERYRMHIAAGVYEITDPSETTSILCERARMALTTAMKDVSRPLVYFDEKMLEKDIISSNIVGEFEKALVSREFQMYLQPQMDSRGRLCGAETLVRWQHPQNGLISPSLFVPVLEDAGLICRLDEFIWEEAARTLKRWKELGKEEYSLSINISVHDFYHLDLYGHFSGLVKKYEIEPGRLKLEITETVLMQDMEHKLEIIGKLRRDGFVVEIDDFGSGYSSLNMLKDFPADVLKIDMVFLRGTMVGDRGRNIIRSVINLAKMLDMSTVVEGVEQEEQFNDLVSMGCEVFQGMYFSEPIPLHEFEKKYFAVSESK